MGARTQAFADAVDRLQEESVAGSASVVAVQKVDLPIWFARSYQRDPEAMRVIRAVDHALERIALSSADQPVKCAGCETGLMDAADFSLVVIMPDTEAGTQLMALGVCDVCGPTSAAILARGVGVMRQIWPGARMVRTCDVVGHA